MKSGLTKLLDALGPYGLRRATRGWRSRCPAHEDRSPSLDIDEGLEGSPLIICRAGCSADSVIAALGFSWSDVLGDDLSRGPDRPARRPANVSREERTSVFDLRNDAGQSVAHHVRTDLPNGRKKFKWRLPDGTMGLRGTPVRSLPLYGAELLSVQQGPVYLCEGEKAAEALRGLGVLALGTVTGASSIPSPESLAVLRGRDVILSPDDDEVGRKHMLAIRRALQGVAATCREVFLAIGDGADAADFVAGGGTRDELERLVRRCSENPGDPPETSRGSASCEFSLGCSPGATPEMFVVPKPKQPGGPR